MRRVLLALVFATSVTACGTAPTAPVGGAGVSTQAPQVTPAAATPKSSPLPSGNPDADYGY